MGKSGPATGTSRPAADISSLQVSRRSYWLDEALRTTPATRARSTEDLAANVCIVGGGSPASGPPMSSASATPHWALC